MAGPERRRGDAPLVPDDIREKNLSLLTAVRRGYYRGEMNPIQVATRLASISDENRLPAVKSVLPLVLEPQRGVLDVCVKNQEGQPWQLSPQTSPWPIFRDFPYGPGTADIDDLTSLDYGLLFQGVEVTGEVNVGKMFASIEDYLVNDVSILECLRLIAISERALANEGGRPPSRVLSFEELRIHLHSTTAIVRVRAGWDKILNNVLRGWFGPSRSGTWPDPLPRRINVLSQQLRSQPPQVLSY